jgi:hypothetical protein
MKTKPKKTLLAIAALAISGVAISSGAAPLDALRGGAHGAPAAQSIVLPASAVTLPEPPPAPAPGDDPALDILAPGTFDWQPELSPSGDMLVVVSLPQQQVHVYRGGVRIGRSTISSGKPGHETPTGVFPILQKQVMHRSTLYDDAPMPYMQRLTWDGVALHAGRLPGYPASHGCIRLPKEFSKLLYGVTNHDTVVIVADYDAFPADVVAPGPTVTPALLAAVAGANQDGEADTQVASTGTAGGALAGIGAAP